MSWTIYKNLLPGSDDTIDIGASATAFKDLYIDGTAYLDAVALGTHTLTPTGNNLAWTGPGGDTLTVTYDIIDLVAATLVNVGTLDVTSGSLVTTSGTFDLQDDSITTTGDITATSFIIGANTLTTSEWANLDGINQTVATTSSPSFVNLTLTDDLFLPTTSSSVGRIFQNNEVRWHTYGSGNLFMSGGAVSVCGNYTLTGTNNICIGRGWSGMTTAQANMCIGYNAGYFLSSGYSNVFVGSGAGQNCTTGHNNVGLGDSACLNIKGAFNMGLGQNALVYTSTGADGNCAIGRGGGWCNVSGSYNSYLGYASGWTDYYIGGTAMTSGTPGDCSFSVAIGAASQVWESQLIALGGNSQYSLCNVSLGTPRSYHFLTLNGSSDRGIGLDRSFQDEAGNDLTVQAGGPPLDGAIVTISQTPTANGSGYKTGDVITIATGDGNAKVTLVYSTNVISLIATGSGYSTGAGQATTGGSGTGMTVNITAVAASTDRNGGDLILSSGVSTGTGTSDVYIKTSPAGSTGTTENTPTVVEKFDSRGVRTSRSLTQEYSSMVTLTDGSATDLFSVAINDEEMVGGTIEYTIYATDGTDLQVHTGIVTFAGVNKAGTISSDIDEVYLAASETEVVTAGTLTDTFAITDNDGSPGNITITLNANSSLDDSVYVTFIVRLHTTNLLTPL